jgi:hypothetical protein
MKQEEGELCNKLHLLLLLLASMQMVQDFVGVPRRLAFSVAQ